MKWLVFVPALAASLVLGHWLKRNQNHAGWLLSVVALLPFVQPGIPELKLALVGWREFPGYTHGLEVTLIDLLAISLLIGLPRTGHSAPLRFVRIAYIATVALSTLQADHPFAASFVLWQLLRMYLLFLVAARACESAAGPAAILRGMAFGVLVVGIVSLVQRYIVGYHEIHGFFSHQNEIGLACNFVMMPAFALLLAQPGGWLAPATLLAGSISIILSLSRGSLLLMGGGFGLVLFLSFVRRATPRKAGVALVAFLAGVVLIGKGFDQIETRFATRGYGAFGGSEGPDERARLELASAMILRDHPMGVGANHFTTVLNEGKYFERAGLTRHQGTDSIIVHNVYWLTLAESGYLGLIALLVLFGRILSLALYRGWQCRLDVRGDILLAFFVATLLFCLHGLVEWVHITRDLQYVFWLAAGVVAGLARQSRVTPGP